MPREMKQILFVVRAQYYENYLKYYPPTETLTCLWSVKKSSEYLPCENFHHSPASLFWKPKCNFLFYPDPFLLDLSSVINIVNVMQLLQSFIFLPDLQKNHNLKRNSSTWEGKWMRGLGSTENVVTYRNVERPEHRKIEQIIWLPCQQFFKDW